jgi:hypothetical protein
MLPFQQPENESQRGGFSSAVWPQKTINAALRHLEIDTFENDVAVRVPITEISRFQAI